MKVLLLADTHLGHDLPIRPRVDRPRRGEDFFANVERALELAIEERVDVALHGGDVFFRSKLPPHVVDRVYALFHRFASRGLRIIAIAGNHERSQFPRSLLAHHPNLDLVDEPRWLCIETRRGKLAIAAFPYARNVARTFPALVDGFTRSRPEADAHVMLFHHAVEGCHCGPGRFVFPAGRDDVIPLAALPRGYAAFLTGHIHRAQVVVGGPAPVLYPGSVERTSFAEIDEVKGVRLLAFGSDTRPGGRLLAGQFRPLPSRPPVLVDVAHLTSSRDQHASIRRALARAPDRAWVRVVGASLRAEEVRAAARGDLVVDVARPKDEPAKGWTAAPQAARSTPT